MEAEERFWSKVFIGDTDECWPWTAAMIKGYGEFNVDGKMKLSHRVSWELANGEIPDDMCVLHDCDNPPCCNPGHLFIGTRADNARDAMEKGRMARGEEHTKAKLDNLDIKFIRMWLELGYTQREIAEAFGVSPVTISDIKRGATWGSLA